MIFYFNIYKDEIFAVRLAKQLNNIFPGVKVVAIADGPCYLHSIEQAIRFNPSLEFIQGDRLKNAPEGGLSFTKRNFSEILKCDFDVAIKLDPDSYIWREPKYIPDADWFGHVVKPRQKFLGEDITFISGGVVGFKRSTVKKIHDSDVITSKQYDSYLTFYDRYNRFSKVADPIGETGRIRTEDWTLAHVCKKLGIEPTEWDDVYCVQTEEQIHPDLKYFATHPVRTVF
jgi:hypothetical protein